MTDRELLEAAAKAAGIHLEETEDGFEADYDSSRIWNPLTDDGDALQLAVKLGMSMCLYKEPHETWASVGIAPGCSEMHDTDPYAATRRAIVRAAAAMEKP